MPDSNLLNSRKCLSLATLHTSPTPVSFKTINSKMESASPSTANGGDKAKSAVPPTVITVDTAAKEALKDATPSKEASEQHKDFGQARTPKHANKTNNDEQPGKDKPISSEHGRAPPPGGGHQRHAAPLPPPHQGYQHEGNYPPPSRPFEGRMGGSGAFQPRERQVYPPRGLPPMQVSPGGRRYYANPGNYHNNGPPNRYNNGPYDQRFGGEYQQHGPPGNYQRGPYGPPMFPPHQQHQQQFSGGYDPSSGQGPPPSWGLPPSFPHGRPPHFGPGGMPPEHYHRGGNTVSRAVSSSFDRSHAHDEKQGHTMNISPKLAPGMPPAGDNGSVSEDGSWGALKQVASVDEDVMRKRSLKKLQEAKEKQLPESTSSSLTNSPTNEGSKKATLPDTNKLTSSLDSLSSVASVQEPMNTGKNAANPSSPGGSAGSTSLDLMKCASGSSGLLLPTHQRSLSQFSFPEADSKRPRDEEREDADTFKIARDDEIRRAPSEDRPAKKSRLDATEAKKTSPLSITCSPPTSPAENKRKSYGKAHQPQPVYAHPLRKASPGQIESFYEHDASFNYSMDSAPNMPVSQMGYLHLPARPGSSSSSTITPMNVDAAVDTRQLPGVGQMPSWELNTQDSFGAVSAGASGPLIPNFSFSQDYSMLSASASQEQMQQPGPPPGHYAGKSNEGQVLESRNQSFEGGHYHGSFSRSDSIMSYEGRMGAPPFEGRQGHGYQGPFPPHAPSWGSAGSYPQPMPPGYGQYRRGGQYPGMMQNYSEDSGRNSPPQGPPGMRVMPPSFQPPPEFRAPPSMVSKSGPQNSHIMSASPYESSKNGPFGWSKEEDMRLTDIMKKYKNPRDWEPISKEHNRGRS